MHGTLLLAAWLVPLVLGSPLVPHEKRVFGPNDVPNFPTEVPSCQACATQWSSISTCAQAAPAFANASQIIWNPVLFVSLIKCSCTDTFSSVYPQCVDCFVQTNQCEQYLCAGAEAAPSVVQGLRSVCGFGSAILGGVATDQASAGTPYTYAGQPHQTGAALTTGVGGVNWSSNQGSPSSAVSTRARYYRAGLATVAGAMACSLL